MTMARKLKATESVLSKALTELREVKAEYNTFIQRDDLKKALREIFDLRSGGRDWWIARAALKRIGEIK